MKVYLIPENKAEEWRGNYEGAAFDPVTDANGNQVVAVSADYSDLPFADQLIACEQIDFKPINLPITQL